MPRRGFDPFASFRFVLEIDAIQVAHFSECTGLQMEAKTFDYKEGGNNQTTLKFPEHVSYGNVTLKRGITTSNDLITWQLEIAQGTFSKFVEKKNRIVALRASAFTIVLRDEKGSQKDEKRWSLVRAFPVKWTGPDLKANAGEIAVESLEIAHEGIRLVSGI